MRKDLLLRLLVLGGACVGAGCADGLDRALRSGDSDRGPRCSPSDDGKRWNLGTGRIDDIKRLSPGFFTSGNAGWRRAGLAPHLKGVSDIRQVSVDGANAFEFLTKEVPYRIRAVRIEDKVAILATAGECPQVTAVDRCVDDQLRTEIEVEGVAACLGPISVPARGITVTMGSRDHLKEELVFGQPVLQATRSDSIEFEIRLPGSQESAGHVERRVNDYSKALPDEVLAFLRAGHEGPAAMLWRNVPEDLKTPDVVKDVAEARAEGVAISGSTVTSPRGVNDFINEHALGVLPGDADTKAALIAKIRALVAEAMRAEPKPQILFEITLYLRLMEPLTAEKPDLGALESKYGPRLSEPGYNEPKIQGSFMVLLPESKYTRELEAEEVVENQRAEIAAKKSAANADLEAAWAEVQGRGDEIATLAYKLAFGRQTFAKTRHNLRGLEAMEKYRAGLVRDAFCPAKRAFLAQAGAAEYGRRATAHCTTEAPTDVGVGGVEKTLTTECKAAFATGC